MSVSEDRRSVLTTFVTAGMGVIGAALAGLVGLVAAPRARDAARRWRRAASVFDSAPISRLRPFSRNARRMAGTRRAPRPSSSSIARVTRHKALSATCSHLGCRVRWDAPKKQYLCPCHGGVYDRDGKVVAGPPPRGLDPVNVRLNPQTWRSRWSCEAGKGHRQLDRRPHAGFRKIASTCSMSRCRPAPGGGSRSAACCCSG